MARLRSTFFDRRYSTLPTGTLEPADKGEAGAEGDYWAKDLQGGGPDVNPELSGSRKFEIYDEMALTDPTIKSLLLFQVLPMSAAAWGLNAKDPADPMAVAIRDAAAWNFGLEGELGELDLSWSGLLRQVATEALKAGNFIGEILWDADARTWRDADGDPHSLWTVSAIAPRPAKTIDKVKREKGRVVEISQIVSGTRPIPAAKALYVVPEPTPGRWEGVSMLRPAWASWVAKKALQIASGIGWDRFASGLPVIFHPDDPDAEERARRIGRAVRQHQRAYVNFPSSGPAEAGSGRPPSEWFLELLNGAATLGDPTPLLRWLCDQEIEAGLAHFAGLGRTESGSRAVAGVQVDPFFLAVQSLADGIRRDFSRQVLRRFVTVNFGAQAADELMPTLTVSKIQARNVEVIARALSLLSAAGFTFTDRGAVDDVRELLGFDTLPEGELADAGISREKLLGILQGLGLDSETFAAIVNALPAEIGIAPNRVPPAEGDGLPFAA